MKHFGFSAPLKRAAALAASHELGRVLCILCAAALLVFSFSPRSTGADTQRAASLLPAGQGWTVMPEGARQTFFGIHGGTTPVSLLATSEGTSLVSFVGATGNDFLALLRKAEIRMPSLLNATQPGRTLSGLPLVPGRGGKLTAGSSTSSLPVFYLSDEMLARLAATPGMLQPFALSSQPLSIEGQVSMPDPFSHAPRYHILVGPQYLQPHKN